jgi:hypothetical protein
MKTIKKAQKGTKMSSSKKEAPMRKFTDADFNRKDSVPSEMFPGKMIPRSALQDVVGPSTYNKTKAKSAPKKKMKDGGSLGMKSVKAGFDKNPGVTRADVIVAAKGKAKYGKKMVKKSK